MLEIVYKPVNLFVGVVMTNQAECSRKAEISNLGWPILVLAGMATCHNTSATKDSVNALSRDGSSLYATLQPIKDQLSALRKAVEESGANGADRDGAQLRRLEAISNVVVSIEKTAQTLQGDLSTHTVNPGEELQKAVATAIKLRLSQSASENKAEDDRIAELVKSGGLNLAAYAWIKAAAEIRPSGFAEKPLRKNC